MEQKVSVEKKNLGILLRTTEAEEQCEREVSIWKSKDCNTVDQEVEVHR